ITMLAYANPQDIQDERQRSDGYGVARFHKSTREITFECWPRFSDVHNGDAAQFPGWPITVAMQDNDGRQPIGWLPEIVAPDGTHPVVQVVDESTGEPVYSVRAASNRFQPVVYAEGTYTLRVGRDAPDGETLTGLSPQERQEAGERNVQL
ncbi:MAG: hypothetical protein KDA75_21600, partial [Planctomycetaceae bacterium]|nr:hypothetical protein [Planctomycetaceae bacterium]